MFCWRSQARCSRTRIRKTQGETATAVPVKALPCGLSGRYEDDPAFPSTLNGRFQGVVLDRARGAATLFNDRYGLQRVYYHQSRDALYFAAEAKAILAVRPELRRVDARALGELVSVGCVLDNKTLFDGIQVLPGASKWTFRNGGVEKQEAYFRPEQWEQQPLLDDESYYQELRSVFSRTVGRYFGGRERVGISLTGGLDTRMILAWHKPAPDSLPCYTFGGSYRDSRDVIVSRRVAGACRQPHRVIGVGEDFLSTFDRYAERTVYLTDGCADVSRSADLYVNELAREITPVRMTGNYGGEVLRRIRAFKPVDPPSGLFDAGLLSEARLARDTYARTIQVHPLTFAVFKQAPWHHYGLLALEETQLALRTPYLDNDLVSTIFRAPLSAITSDESCLRLIQEGDPTLAAIPTDRGLGQQGLVTSVRRAVHQFSFKAEVHVRLWDAAVGGQGGPSALAAQARACVSGPAQVLSLPHLVPGFFGPLRSRHAAGSQKPGPAVREPADSRIRCERPSERGPEPHARDPQAAHARTGSSALRGFCR